MREDLSALVIRRRRELGISNAEIARRAGLSRSYIGNIVNRTAPTQTGQYVLSPENARNLARAIDVSEEEVAMAMNYFDNMPDLSPKSFAELLAALEKLGIDIEFDGNPEDYGPEDLEELKQRIALDTDLTIRRKKK